MKLRICDRERERILPGTGEAIGAVFAAGSPLNPGTEITLSGPGGWLSPTVLEPAEQAVYLMAGATGAGTRDRRARMG